MVLNSDYTENRREPLGYLFTLKSFFFKLLPLTARPIRSFSIKRRSRWILRYEGQRGSKSVIVVDSAIGYKQLEDRNWTEPSRTPELSFPFYLSFPRVYDPDPPTHFLQSPLPLFKSIAL